MSVMAGSTLLLHPSPAIADEVPIEQIRLPWHVRRTLSEAGLKTVGDVRKASPEAMLGLSLSRGRIDYIRATLG
jgi:hypothetical protein